MSNSAPLSNIDQISHQIADLETSLRGKLPAYESLLHTIHKNLHADEALVHLLTEEQVGIIITGLMKKKQVVINETAAKGKTASGKKLKDIGMDDLGM